MNKNRKKKKEIPWTGILAAIVGVLLLCACVLAWLYFQNEADRREDRAQSGAHAGMRQTEEETGQIENESTLPDAETSSKGAEADSEMETSSEGAEADSETEISSEGAEADSETETSSEAEQEAHFVVAIDPGHQGSWVDMSDTEPIGPGASEMKVKATTGTQGSFSGKAEFELNLEISLLLREELLDRGYEVVLTREDHDTAISNAERAQMAYEQGGDIYVRIHANGSDDPGVQGALAMVPSPSNPYVGNLAGDSYLLASCILDSYCRSAQFESLGIQYYDNMSGINWSRIPVMILEMGFMTNESDDLRMADTKVQKQMAEGIADGIDAYFEQQVDTQKEVSQQAQDSMQGLIEQIGEDFLYPRLDQGETWTVSIEDLDTGAAGNIDGERQMKSASVIKVFIMAAVYDRICYPVSEERRISFEETYDGELKQLLTDMITVSDNSAANTLVRALGGGDAQAGMAVVNQYCEENGYSNTHMGRLFLEENPSGDNFTSANDCCGLLKAIYEGACVCPEASEKMYEYLKHQTRTGKIPAGLSGLATAANKTGELYGEYGDFVENDIAVIEDEKGAYVLCVLSSGLQDNGDGMRRIANISETVCAYRSVS